MSRDGKYIYCIIATRNECNFGEIGVGGKGNIVNSIGFEGLSMVVSDHRLNSIEVNSENILAHQKVIEVVMSEYNSVIPVRFGTVAATPDEIRNLLDRRYAELSELILRFENKVEYNVKGIWKDMNFIYKEIDDKNLLLHQLREDIERSTDTTIRESKILDASGLIDENLKAMRVSAQEELESLLRKTTVGCKSNAISADAMFMNTAFLLNQGREKEFENILTSYAELYPEKFDFIIAGPLPTFSFIDLHILPEKWERND